MADSHRSGCPINLSLEVIGDKWSLLVIRDMMFGNRRHFRELLTGSQERIASNILADRLQRLVDRGLIARAPDPSHRQKVIYSLTEPAIQLVPVMAALGTWGRHHLPVSPSCRSAPSCSNAAAPSCGRRSWTSSASCTLAWTVGRPPDRCWPS